MLDDTFKDYVHGNIIIDKECKYIYGRYTATIEFIAYWSMALTVTNILINVY